jgi:rhodanese-related sulfurtransferase
MVLLMSACSPAGSVPPAAAGAAAPAAEIRHVNAVEARALVVDQKIPVLDLRTPQEFGVAHIPGARLLDFTAADFATKLGELDRHQTYLIHCASGRRSKMSLDRFQQLGFKEVIHLDGGFNAWMAANLPVEK